MKNTRRFVLSGLLLSLVSLVLRSVGVSFGAYLSRRMGAAGTGTYHLLLSVFSPAATFSVAGVHLAVSRLVAAELGKEENGRPRPILKTALLYALTVSGIVAALLFLPAEWLTELAVGDRRLAPALRILAVSLPFVSLSAAMNGYFTAVRRVAKTAAVQVTDQIVRVFLTVLLLSRTPEDPTAAVKAIVLAAVGTDALSCLFLALLCRRDAAGLPGGGEALPGAAGRVLAITLPVSFSSCLRSGLISLEHLLIPRGLRRHGASYLAAMASYGAVTGMAMPIVLFPASFLTAFTGLLIPEFAEAEERGERAGIAALAGRMVRIVLTFSIGAAGLLLAFADDLGSAIYHNEEAARYLGILAPLIPVMYLDTAVDSVLKGVGEQVYSMKVNVADALLSVLLVWLLVPRIGLAGYLIVIFVSEIFNFALSFTRMTAVTGADRRLLRHALRPLAAAAGSTCLVKTALAASPFAWPPGVTAAVGIAASAVLYALFLFLPSVKKPNPITIRKLKE